MSSTAQPKRPGFEIDEETKRVLDEHAMAAEKEPGRVSRKELLEEGLANSKRRSPIEAGRILKARTTRD